MTARILGLAMLAALLGACSLPHECTDYACINGARIRERYTLRIVDEESRVVLIDEARSAVYDRSASDDCHTCWHTEMTL